MCWTVLLSQQVTLQQILSQLCQVILVADSQPQAASLHSNLAVACQPCPVQTSQEVNLVSNLALGHHLQTHM